VFGDGGARAPVSYCPGGGKKFPNRLSGPVAACHGTGAVCRPALERRPGMRTVHRIRSVLRMTPQATPTPGADWRARWQWLRDGAVRSFHAYANWLVGISWRRFFVLSLLLLILMAIVHDFFNFSWRTTTEVTDPPRRLSRVDPPSPPSPPSVPIRIQGDKPGEGVDISIGKDGIRITPKSATGPAASASAAASAEAHAEAAVREAEKAIAAVASAAGRGVRIVVPEGTADKAVQEALDAAREEIRNQVRESVRESVREAQRAMEEAARDAEDARRDAEEARREAAQFQREIDQLEGQVVRVGTHTIRFGLGDFLMQFTIAWIVASAILKFTYKGTQQAQKQAARATETAEAESLKRQVVEARMAAMQAQVEPHFLFNTLASIDHLIETDPARASQMQRNLIALLRASMPTMREAAGGKGNGVRDLGREIAVIRPYLEILKVRMEERLTTEVAVPEGLMSAEFPPMMLQTLVENAIKHGLEPKAEGGHLRVAAEIVHGKLQMTVADTGLGFGKAATAGTGVGLANIRERLQLLYGNRASLTVAENQPSGTVVTITVPYKPVEEMAS
jgi:signal transduction histidine kinase